MTPQELIRYIVINNALADGHFEGQIEDIKTLTAEQINEFYDELEEAGEEYPAAAMGARGGRFHRAPVRREAPADAGGDQRDRAGHAGLHPASV